MTAALVYSSLALIILIVVALLARGSGTGGGAQPEEDEREDFQGFGEDSGLILGERILDPADYFWLRDELGFPRLAESLRHHRQRLALQWLNAVRSSFSEMVRNPEPASHSRTGGETSESWQLLRLTLRFHLLLGYAILVVRFFGPYHRLLPSLGWMGSPWRALPPSDVEREPSFRRSS